VFRLAWSCTGSRQDAEDVTQTVFLKVLERRPDLEPGKERAWLFWVAVNECRSLWRRLKLRRTEPLEEALAVANDSEYGLSAAVYSRDSARAWNVAQRLHTGICHINGPTVHDEAQMPFGGCKASGYGRFGGRAGIAEFTELRWITIQTQPRELPF